MSYPLHRIVPKHLRILVNISMVSCFWVILWSYADAKPWGEAGKCLNQLVATVVGRDLTARGEKSKDRGPETIQTLSFVIGNQWSRGTLIIRNILISLSDVGRSCSECGLVNTTDWVVTLSSPMLQESWGNAFLSKDKGPDESLFSKLVVWEVPIPADLVLQTRDILAGFKNILLWLCAWPKISCISSTPTCSRITGWNITNQSQIENPKLGPFWNH